MNLLQRLFDQSKYPGYKRKYTLGPYSIILLKESIESSTNRKSNIVAIDSLGALCWVAETPWTGFTYFELQVDEDNNTIEGDGGDGMIYTISLSDGRILDSKLIK